MLDDLGLLVAIEAWLERRRGGGLLIASEFAIPAPEQGRTGLDPELETTIYRLPQEALTNIGKNAGACTVCIQVAVANGLVKIEVQDDGVGFDLETRDGGLRSCRGCAMGCISPTARSRSRPAGKARCCGLCCQPGTRDGPPARQELTRREVGA